MASSEKDTVDKGVKPHLLDKRRELIWALKLQGYSNADIGNMFGKHRSRIGVIVRQMPVNWKPKWQKVQD